MIPPTILASAREGLRSTFRMRAHLPFSPWGAYLGVGGGIIIARADDPEDPILDEWRFLCRVNNARTDDYNVHAIGEALARGIP